MENNAIFKISNLSCVYNQDRGNTIPALVIDDLEIPRGKLTILLGESGIGKSTILETLGLMNDTVAKGSNLLFTPGNGDGDIQFATLWQRNDTEIAGIRNKHFSFIFQSTNLMPNFTAYENICLTQMLQGKDQTSAVANAEKYMRMVGLGAVEKDKKAFELSGGQRQRLAFVRAITCEFSVLFGDEPTGNLDEGNSKELMTLLKNVINTENKSSIIVSHNIDLALEFGDQIIILTRSSKGHGEILRQNIYDGAPNKEGIKVWTSKTGKVLGDDARSVLKKIIGLK